MIGKTNARMVDGKLVANSNDPENFGRVAKIFIDPKANEAYVADGYFNKRVAVVDMDSGKIKRYWGAYGNKPDDAPLRRYDPKAPLSQQFRTPVHCAELSDDGFVYVCDRANDRIQVFTKEGKFVKEKQLFPETFSDGSVWDIAFSRDPQQRFLYVADGANEHVYILDRNSLELLTSSAPAAGSRAVLRRAQHCDRFEGQHLHHRNLHRQAFAEVRLQGHGPRRAQAGRAVAEAGPVSGRHVRQVGR